MKNCFLYIALWSIVLCVQAHQNDICVPVDLTCEYLVNPIGLDVSNPRLAWKLQDSRSGAMQTACRIWVDTDSLSVVEEKASVWDTGKRESDRILWTYAGSALRPFTKYYWKVTVWDKDGKSASSFVQSFETGIMDISQWQGSWISDNHDVYYKPAPYFRRVFEVGKSVESARAYITVAGLYELYINGNRVGNHILDPMYTRYDRRNLYVTYDVTSQLQRGKNVIGVLLGNGWYNHQSLAVWNFHNAPWRNRPTFCLDLKIVYEDGSIEIVSSDKDWKTSTGSLISNSIYTGEHYDARQEQKEWSTIEFNDSEWEDVIYRSAPSQKIVAQQMHPIRVVDTVNTVKLNKINDTIYVFDFGRNIAGITSLKVRGESGTAIRLKHGERIYPNGLVDVSNIDVYCQPVVLSDPFQTDIIILNGGEEEKFVTKFNYKGFRYVEVTSNNPIELVKENLTAYFIHSDVPQVGFIHSSDSLINRLWRATNNSYLSNFVGYPTDCPQREKNGWTGDAHLAIETALYNFDGITVYEKWLADHRDEQQPNGVLPDIIPTGGWGYGSKNGLDWTSTIAIIPWNIYLFYGDSKLLFDCYENIKRYVDYVDRNSPGGLTSWGRGDWVPVKSHASVELTSSVYFYVDATILARAAKLFDKCEDYARYSALAKKIKDAINEKYLNRKTGIYANGVQTELAVPLMWGIVPEDMKEMVAYNLAQEVVDRGYHLDVGVLGAKAILNALSENGQSEVAYKLACQHTYPSWGHWIVNGATTLLENWDLQATRDISDNHMMFGEIGGWFFKGLGGIYPDWEEPGFKHIILRPYFPAGLSNFEARHNSPYGEICSKWELKRNKVIYTVVVPANSYASLYLPDKTGQNTPVKLTAGEHVFTLKKEAF